MGRELPDGEVVKEIIELLKLIDQYGEVNPHQGALKALNKLHIKLFSEGFCLSCSGNKAKLVKKMRSLI